EFVHDAHIRFFTEQDSMTPSEVCTLCHGEVNKMIVVKQVRELKMGDCLGCHRKNNAPTDCAICHY
ncbi:MAG: cytochrome c3, partial [Dehalococcoidia bacterium]